MSYSVIKSFAKINLALNITGKTPLLHKIETLVTFIELHDVIFIKKTNKKNHQVFFYGNFSKNISNYNNTVIKLLNILDQKNLLNNHKFQIRIQKNIPQKAGLGGGSMNAANILNYFLKKKILKIKNKDIVNITSLIGSDVFLGINQTNTIFTSNNNIKRFFKCPRYHVLLAKPNFGCSTKTIYSLVKNFTRAKFNFQKKLLLSSEFLIDQSNALEKVAFLKYPILKTIKSFLESLITPIFVRMTGSGSVIVGYYQFKKDCEMAKVHFKRKFKNFWCITSKTI